GLEPRDRGFATELVYGVTRMRRACDFLVDRFLMRDDVDPPVRAALRLGAYQLVLLGTPAHAAVGETVAAVPKRVRGLVNAVLRKVAADGITPGDHGSWPDEATRLSYPDWIVAQLTADLGAADARAALEHMNTAATVAVRADGYRQDPSSQLVAGLVEPDGVIIDLCAAPGGKATALAGSNRFVVAADLRPSRLGLVVKNRDELGLAQGLAVMVNDGTASGLRSAGADAVLVDAPCSGLGALRRRPDARWRIQLDAVGRLADLQVELLAEAARLVKPGGQVVYSVCTLTGAETVDVVERARVADLGLQLAAAPTGDGWQVRGPGAQILPHVSDSDGMFAARFTKS
ncbi:MAG: hypothetical protein HKN26_14755, partial [Acidimicrobiales bacterium]|nr:hypothetical protein [Acidimicrobiales bacterium]